MCKHVLFYVSVFVTFKFKANVTGHFYFQLNYIQLKWNLIVFIYNYSIQDKKAVKNVYKCARTRVCVRVCVCVCVCVSVCFKSVSILFIICCTRKMIASRMLPEIFSGKLFTENVGVDFKCRTRHVCIYSLLSITLTPLTVIMKKHTKKKDSIAEYLISQTVVMLYLFVAASHQAQLDARSKARRLIKVGIKGKGMSGTRRDSNSAGLCCSSAHFVPCEPDETSSFSGSGYVCRIMA